MADLYRERAAAQELWPVSGMSDPRHELKAELVELVQELWAAGVFETKYLAAATGRSQERIRRLIMDLKLKRPRSTWNECKATLPPSLLLRITKFRERSRNRKSLPWLT